MTENSSMTTTKPSSGPPALSGLSRTLFDDPALAEIAAKPRLVLVLMWSTLHAYAMSYRQALHKRLGRYLLRFLAGSVIGFIVIAITQQVASVAGIDVLFASCAMSFVVIIAAAAMRRRASTNAIRMVVRKKCLQRFRIGQLESLLHPRRGRVLVLILGVMLGLEFGTFYFNSEALQLADRGLFGQLLLSIDNFCYGAFLDVFELYGLSLAPAVEHANGSANVFFLFRTAFDVVIVFLVYLAYRRYELRSVILRFPVHETPSVDLLVEWIDRTIIDTDSWQQQFPHEMSFLLIVQNYFEDEYLAIVEIAAEWPALRIEKDVRRLFFDSAD